MDTPAPTNTNKFEEWAKVELFGHAKIIGKVTEATIAGGAFLRVDVPDGTGKILYTRYFGPGAIYSMSPITEELALQLAPQIIAVPVTVYDLPKQLPARHDDDDGREEY